MAAQGGLGDKTGERIGSTFKGILQGAHGSGEAIRGTINTALDSMGDAVAGRERGSVQSGSQPEKRAEDNSTTYQRGIDELKQGIDNVTGKSKGAGTVGTESSKPAGATADSTSSTTQTHTLE